MARPKKEKLQTTSAPKSGSIKPLAGYVLIEPVEAQATTASGIILPESAQERPAMGTVLSTGEDLFLENGKILKAPVKVGDKVFYKKWGGDEIKVDGKELKLVKFDDLMAIVV